MRFLHRCHFSQGNSAHFEIGGVKKKNSVEAYVLGIVRFTQARDTFLPTTKKRRRTVKRKKDKNRVKPHRPLSIDVTFLKGKVHFAHWDATSAVTASRRETKR